MNIILKLVILAAALGIIRVVVKSVKKHNLHPSYAVLWIFMGLFLGSIAVLEGFYAYVARSVFGLYGGDHLIYITLITFLLVYSFYLTTRMCQQADRVSKLISFTAVLESEINILKNSKRDS